MTLFGDFFRRIWGILFGRPYSFWWGIEGTLAGGSKPWTRAELMWLKRRGVTAILSLTREPLREDWVGELDLKYLHVPVEDHSAPTREQLERASAFLRKVVVDGQTAAVHCSAGKGRTGTVIAAYLALFGGESVETAIAKVREKRPGAIEKKQESTLKKYFSEIKQPDS